jgi:NB-ARC domain-containing protein
MVAAMSSETVAGRIAVGRLLVEIGEPHGAVLREAMRGERAHLHARPAPIILRPRLLRGLVDRRTEVAAAISAIDSGMLVEVSGESGIGKTALLRHLAHHPRASTFADGIVYVPARNDSSIDLLQSIFEAFYDSDTLCLPTNAEIRRGLQDKHALILLDAIKVSQEDLDLALDSAPRCAFVVATRERRLWGELRSLALTGLPSEDAAVLLEREAGRSLDAADRPAAERLCAAIGGNPLRIQQAASLIRERDLSLETWAAHLTAESIITELMTSSDDKQRRVLLALSALPGVPIEIQHVSGIAELADVEALTMPLVRRGLVVTTQSRYLLADGVADRLRRTEDLKPWVNRAITYFTAWAERNRRNRESLLEAADALARVQDQAADMKRWGEVLRLGRLLEVTLVLHRRWGAWEIVIDRCLAAAKATGDRAAEAWALHELGTRAVCLGDAQRARRLLGEAAILRDRLGEPGAAAVSRQNLGFIAPAAPPVDETSQPPQRARFDDAGERDSLVMPPHAPVTRRRSGWAERAALMLTFALSAIVAALAYNEASGGPSILQMLSQRESIETTATSSVKPPLAARNAAPASTPPLAASGSQKPTILIFTARPGSIATARPTDLCYAVSDAVEARIEPGIGSVAAADTLTCRRVTPARTTTYELTAIGRDGDRITQQLVIVVR